MSDPKDLQPSMDAADLYREEIYTDRKVGTIRVMTPVAPDGSTDPARPVPITFEIEANSLAEAVAKFGAAAKVALEETVRELQELRRQAASQIVIPEPGATSQILGPGGLPPRGGGKIHL